MQKSERIQAVWEELQEQFEDDAEKSDALDETSDSSCTLGFDNDGSTGFELFENGYQLAVKAAGRPIFYVEAGDNVDGSALFFIGTEDEIEAKLRASVA